MQESAVRRLIAALLLLCLLGAPVRAEDDPLARAARLRDDSVADWKAKRFADAAEKLRRAAAIYEGLEAPPTADLAVTLRALAWNEKDAGQPANLVRTFVRLEKLVAADASLSGELMNAFGALFQGASAQADWPRAEAMLKPPLTKAYALGLDELVGQILHSTGSIAREKSQGRAAIDYYERAIRKRTEISDLAGLCWSLNNLANVHLVLRNAPLDALDPLDRAHALVHEESVVEPQAAVGVNAGLALDALDKRMAEAPAKEAYAWIKRMLLRVGHSRAGAAVSYARLGRSWLAWAAKAEDARQVERAGRTIVAGKPLRQPLEVRADLAIRAAQAALAVDRPALAKRWLEGLDTGTGPLAAHLAARAAVVRAEALAARKTTRKRFEAAARKAFAAWEAASDRRGRKDALRALLRAAGRAEALEALADVQRALNDLEAQGVPGGAGGVATASANLRRYRELALDDALFTIRSGGKGLELTDVATNASQTFEVRWQPRHIGFNGLQLLLFGGYVVVEKLDYGGPAGVPGGAGEARLDELGDTLAVPGGGTLVIQKNGAVRYRLR